MMLDFFDLMLCLTDRDACDYLCEGVSSNLDFFSDESMGISSSLSGILYFEDYETFLLISFF
jgi:hypothetical protein